MTLAQIIKLALRQLDEDPADVGDYSETFTVYANLGYTIAMKMYYKPVEKMGTKTDEDGIVYLDGMGVARVVSVSGEGGRDVWFQTTPDGTGIATGRAEADVTIIYEPEVTELTMQDVPKLPESAHPALADYICYRHLSSGSLAKQARAEFFRNSFYQQMTLIRPQNSGSVTRMKNLYAATDLRSR